MNIFLTIILLLSFQLGAEEGLPKRFRTCTEPFKFTFGDRPSKEGLDNLQASGSGQFSKKELECLRKKLPFPCFIIDLRKEDHDFENDQTEEAVVKRYGFGYYRIGVIDGGIPTNEEVDNFISFIKQLDSKVWLHFHCAAGRGRTTTFLALYDMLHNAKNVSFSDIIKRQYLLGGMNLNKHSKEDARKRLAFLKHFYKFCYETNPRESSFSNFVPASFKQEIASDFNSLTKPLSSG